MRMDTKNILKKAKVVAVIGCSRNPGKPAHDVPEHLQSHGYKIIPINPLAEEILGERCYKNVNDIPVEVQKQIDIIDIFRPSDEMPKIIDDIIKMQFKPKFIWMQLGISHEKAAEKARKNGISVIMNKCIMIEHKKHFK